MGRCCDGALERERQEGSLQGRCGRWGLENSNSSERLHIQEVPQQAVAGRGKGGIVGRLERGEGEAALRLEGRGGMGTHCHLASLALVPPGPSLALCTAGSVSKDVCLFLDQRFISFHFDCLLLSWACESAGLCYKGEPWPCEPNFPIWPRVSSSLRVTIWGVSGDDLMILWSLAVSYMGQEISGSHLSSVADLLYDLEQVLSPFWVSKFLLLFWFFITKMAMTILTS